MKRPYAPAVTPADAQEIEPRFWPKVDRRGPNECWLWQSSRSRGYGTIFAWGRPQYAHRIAYALQRGPVPAGVQVLHTCDNPPCCNPSHLFLGTQLDNMRDRNSKGRANVARGERAGTATLTNEQALAIYSASGLYREIAAAFSTTVAVVGKIKHGKTWRHVTGGARKRRYRNETLPRPALAVE
jgi:hypothetical protein